MVGVLVVVDSTLRFTGGGDTPGEADLFIALTPANILRLIIRKMAAEFGVSAIILGLWGCVLGRYARERNLCGETRAVSSWPSRRHMPAFMELGINRQQCPIALDLDTTGKFSTRKVQEGSY